MSTVIDTITDMIKDPLEEMGLWVVRVRMMGGDEATILQIMIDRLDGSLVDVKNCENASHMISALMDVEDPIKNAYDLEVSTPGIDRPLVRVQDWKKYVGHLAKAELRNPTAEGRRRFKGTIVSFENDIIVLEVDNSQVEIEFNEIESASLVLTDELLDFCKAELDAMNNSDENKDG